MILTSVFSFEFTAVKSGCPERVCANGFMLCHPNTLFGLMDFYIVPFCHSVALIYSNGCK
jgi:hypothetical protein